MGKRMGNLMEIVQEFNLDIKPAKIFKGHRLCKLVVGAQDQINAEYLGWENELSLWCGKALYVPLGK
jgi:hypothetical protein